ncbi:hypothetical protein [Devosia sp.]|uniref:hypothetical protein n=1 Tax=Devosia sp. TaxID=1871048 RepID=UPI00326444E9
MMPPIYVLARDHLERAAVILRSDDRRSQQIRSIIERTINLMETDRFDRPEQTGNVLDFHQYRRRKDDRQLL